MTDLDNLKLMLHNADIQYEVEVDSIADELDLSFRPQDMNEDVIFVFNNSGDLQYVI